MLKANLKSVFFIILVTTLTLLVGCSAPKDKKAVQIDEARALSEQGSNAEALKILEDLTAQYPNDIQILKSIGQIYAKEGDATMAAFFLEQAYLQSPEDTELLFQAYQSLEAANQPAGPLLEKLSSQAPEVMTPELWVRLGEIRQAENKVQPALDAYLKGVDPDIRKPAPETAAAIGQLFIQAGNLPQAKNWLEIAAENDDPNAMTALFGLLEINLQQKDWPAAEATISRLDQQFPGAIEASQWQQARQELVRWRKAQDAMKAQLAKDEARKKAAEAKAKLEAEAEAKAEAEAEAKAKAAAVASTTSGQADTQADTSAAATTEGKAQVIADLEAAEAMADTPAIESTDAAPTDDSTATSTSEGSGSKTIAFDPMIAIEPADPEITFDVSYDQAPLAEETTYAVETSDTQDNTVAVEPAPAIEAFPPIDTQIQPEPEPIRPNVRPSQDPATIEELMADAETATLDRDFKAAIRKYWAAISIANNRAEIWNLLSRAYLVDGQLNNAETTALEAVRLDPREVAYTLDYLRVAQRSKNATDFLAQLETAYARFPASPEITLSLARAHERISKQMDTAHNLYLRFIDIAPNHPLIPEARAAVLRTE